MRGKFIPSQGCQRCWGYGLYDYEDKNFNVSISRIMADAGWRTVPCPECGADANPKGKRNIYP